MLVNQAPYGSTPLSQIPYRWIKNGEEKGTDKRDEVAKREKRLEVVPSKFQNAVADVYTAGSTSPVFSMICQ